MEVEHEYTEEVVCPWCGHEHGDSWEWTSNSDDMKCDECGKEFGYEKDITVKYCTSKKQCEEDNHKYENDTDCSYLYYHKFEGPVKNEEDWEFIEIQKCSICDDKTYTKTIPRNEWIKKYPMAWERYQKSIERDKLKYGLECDNDVLEKNDERGAQ